MTDTPDANASSPIEPDENAGTTDAAASAAPTAVSQAATPPRSRARKWMFRLIAVVVIPLLVLLLLEGALRLVGYGDPDTMFTRTDDGRVVTRAQFGRRFFPPALLRAPLPHALDVPKPATTYRIFVLGGSAAKGVPEPAFAFARMLEVMLAEAYPEREFEVVNTALSAVNSHVVLPVARECADLEPDMFIVYMGNNEVIGPFGPGTVFDAFTASREAIQSGAKLKRLRTGQLIGDIAGMFSADRDELRVWKGMELFLDNLIRADDPRLQTVYSHLHDNLADIIDLGADAGAEVVVCTMASNLRDNPPFASLHGDGAFEQETDREGWRLLMDAADAAWADGDAGSAAANAREAMVLDDQHAGAHYRLAQAELALGNADEAMEHFQRALELDALRFRADRGINRAIIDAAESRKAPVIDVVGRAATQAGHGIAGFDLFREHVHLTFDGHYMIAAALFEHITATIGNAADGTPETPSRETVAARLAYTPWSEFKMADSIAALMARPPFTNQLDHEQMLAAQREQVSALRASLTQDQFVATDAVFQDAIDRRHHDALLRAHYATFLSEVGEDREATAHWQRLVDDWPDRFDWRTDLARGLMQAGRVEDAVREFERVAENAPLVADAQANLGGAYMRALRFADAARALDRAVELNPGHAPAHARLAEIAFRGGDEAAGIEHLKLATSTTPPFPPAVQQLGWLLATHGNPNVRDPEEAARIIESLPPEVVLADPRLLDALAAAKAHLGAFDEAIALATAAEQLVRRQDNPQAAQAIAARIAMYHQGRAFVMP